MTTTIYIILVLLSRHIKGHINVADEPHCCFDNQPYGQCTNLVPNHQVRSVLRLLLRMF